MRSVTVSTTSFTTKNTGNSMRPSATGRRSGKPAVCGLGIPGQEKDKKTNETILERHKALHALCEICHKIGIEVRSGQLTFELLWWILDPILFMLVYWFIFMVIFGQKKEYFHIFVFVGLSMWNLF